MIRVSEFRTDESKENFYNIATLAGAMVMLFVIPFVFAPLIRLISGDDLNLANVISLCLLHLSVIATICIVAYIMRGKSSMREMLYLEKTKHFSIKRTVLMFLLMYLSMAILIDFTDSTATLFGISLPKQSTVELASKLTPGLFALMAFSTVILAPVSEELLFRHVFFSAVTDATNIKVGLVIVPVAFSLLHMNILCGASLFVLGFVLQLAYIHSRNLLVPIGMHATFNALNMAMLFFNADSI